jgi:phage-related protein
MPITHVVFYQDADGKSPVVEWLNELGTTDEKTFDKCRAALARLAILGHELRRPEADLLRDGIHELRIRRRSVNYRLLYFFYGRTVSVVAHGLTKEATVPIADINRAIARRDAFNSNPGSHTFKGELYDG